MVALLASFAGSDTRRKFSDFPALIYNGPTASLDLVSRQDFLFKAMLREAWKQRPHFAGHYILASWGCGSTCIETAAINALTGRVTWLPFTLCCWRADVDDPRSFRVDSRLLLLRGQRNGTGEAGPWRYVLGPRGFRPIHSTDP